MCELCVDIELCEDTELYFHMGEAFVCRPQNGSRAELLKEEMDYVIVILSYFWLSLQLWTDLLFFFYRKRSACTFFHVLRAHSAVDVFPVSSNLTKCETLDFVQCIFNLCFKSFVVILYEAPPFSEPFDVMKSKWQRMFPSAYSECYSFALCNHRFNEVRISLTPSMFLSLSTQSESSLCMRCFTRKTCVY